MEVEVHDNGIGRQETGASADGSGHGLIGMRERVLMYGGQLEVSSASGAGFQVRAVLPLEEAS